MLAECRGGCAAPNQPPANVPVGNETVLRGEIPIESRGGNVSTSTQIVRVILASGADSSGARPDSRRPLGPVRCDAGGRAFGFSGRQLAGCVYPDAVPTLTLNASSAPQHTAFVGWRSARCIHREFSRARW
ncbi:hypothetical protein BJF78_24705 [Pseudonocardia sp. CNS-139]|nr:hypothetical protein BJF78_24705 [Pseudonocardia sp. CNS-139]